MWTKKAQKPRKNRRILWKEKNIQKIFAQLRDNDKQDFPARPLSIFITPFWFPTLVCDYFDMSHNKDADEDVFEDALEVAPQMEGNQRPHVHSKTNSDESSGRLKQQRQRASSNVDADSTTEIQDEGEDGNFLDASQEDLQKSLADLGLSNVESEYLDPATASQTLDKDLVEIKVAVNAFLNSHFLEAETMLKKKYKVSLYYTHAYSTLLTIRAIMTFDPTDIKHALALQYSTVDIATFYRKKDHGIIGNIAGMVKGHSLDNMTRLQRHAELIFAECFLMKAVLTIVNDDSFLSFLREGINIRNSFLVLKQCYKWINKQYASHLNVSDKKMAFLISGAAEDVSLPPNVDVDFISGVALCVGLFNVLLSMLPEKILKIVEVIGFSGSQSTGLRLLQHPHIGEGLRRFLCDILLMVYHCILPSVITSIEKDKVLADRLTSSDLQQHPNGTLALFFFAKNLMSNGNVAEAVPWFRKSIDSQKDWEQLHHICYWETSHCHYIQLQFFEASKCLEILARDSRWSKAVYTYLQAAYLFTALDLGEITEHGEYTHAKVISLMSSVNGKVQKIAGKRIPIEKFVARKARKFLAQGNRLFLPGFEMMMIWNGFAFMKPATLNKAASIVDDRIKQMEVCPEADRAANHFDDLFLAYLFRAIILRDSKQYLESMETFYTALGMEKQLTLDHYLAPFARYELGRLFMQMNPPMIKEAKVEFETIKKDYKKYSLENTVHFRIHNATRRLKQLESGKASDDLIDPTEGMSADTEPSP